MRPHPQRKIEIAQLSPYGVDVFRIANEETQAAIDVDHVDRNAALGQPLEDHEIEVGAMLDVFALDDAEECPRRAAR